MPKQEAAKKRQTWLDSSHVSASIACPSLLLTSNIENTRNQPIALEGELEGVYVSILIDSGASGNFISRKFLENSENMTKKLEKPQEISLADGSIKYCNRFTRKLSIKISDFSDRILSVSPLILESMMLY